MSLAVQVPPSRGGDNDSELLSSARCPAQFAAALDSALLQAKREADGITAAQLRLAGALGAGAAYGLGLWSASGAEVATVWLGATAAGLAASSTSLLLYLIIFRFFQLVPVLQERVMICGSPLALAWRLALASLVASGRLGWGLVFVNLMAAGLLAVAGWHAARGRGAPLRMFGTSGAAMMRAMQRLPLCGLPPAGAAGLGSDHLGNARDLPPDSMALLARMPMGWRATPLLGVLAVLEGADALAALPAVSASRHAIAGAASPVWPLLMGASALPLLGVRTAYLALALPIADRPHLRPERPAGAALILLGAMWTMCQLAGLPPPALPQLAGAGVVMALGMCLSAEERLAGQEPAAETPARNLEYAFLRADTGGTESSYGEGLVAEMAHPRPPAPAAPQSAMQRDPGTA